MLNNLYFDFAKQNILFDKKMAELIKEMGLRMKCSFQSSVGETGNEMVEVFIVTARYSSSMVIKVMLAGNVLRTVTNKTIETLSKSYL